MDRENRLTGRHNYSLNAATVLRDVYRLLTTIMADLPITQTTKSATDPIARLRRRFIEDEVIHLLIGTAVANRLQDEDMRDSRKDREGFNSTAFQCGLLQSDVEEDHLGPLSFREACNKIVHAQHITAEFDTSEEDFAVAVPQALVLRGKHGSKAWIAYIGIPDYCRGSVLNFDPL